MKNITYCLLFLFPLCTGCSSAYIPSSKNVPLFEEKGEVQIETGVSTNSLYLTGSYAFSDNYAVIANGSASYPALVGKPIRGYSETMIFLDGDVPHYSCEAGFGRYNLLPLSERRLEVFAGAGYGMSYSYFSEGNKGNYMQGFVQINTGKRYEHAEIGWALRAAYVGFQYQYEYHKSQFENGIRQPDKLIIEHGNIQTFHLEPLFVIRTGGRVKWFARTGLNLAFPFFDDTIFHFSTGLSCRF